MRPHERGGRPGERRRRAAAPPFVNPMDARVGSVPRARARDPAAPSSARNQADAGREPAHAEEEEAARPRCRTPARARRARPRAPAKMAGALAARRPRPPVARAVAVAVAVVAVPAGPFAVDLIVASTTWSDLAMSRSPTGKLAETDELEEAGVDHLALVERRAAVADVVRDRRVRVARLREPDEVPRRMRPGGRHGPALHLPLPGIGDAQPDHGGRRVAVRPGELRRRDQAGDAPGDRRRRVAALLLPALDAERRPARGDEVRGRLDVVRVQRTRR